MPRTVKKKWREIYDSNKLIVQEQIFTITPAGLDRRSDTETSSYRWSDFYAFEETKDAFLIYIAKMQCYYLPKHVVDNETQMALLRRYFQKIAPLKKEPWLSRPLIILLAFMGVFVVIMAALLLASLSQR
jgi:hypothetical protein